MNGSRPHLSRRLRARDARLRFAAGLLLACLSVLALQAVAGGPAAATDRSEPVATASPAVRVIDGDTVQIGAVVYRIANIDTPETGPRAQCPEERARASAATAHARALVAQARVLEPEPERLDRYGRTVARLRLDGQDFGDAMIAAGHARPWRGRREPWCAPAG